MKDFEAIYRAEGRYHHQRTGFPAWWSHENYRILAGWIEAGERVLDLACGDGGLWPYVQTAEIVGTDLAPTGLTLARDRPELRRPGEHELHPLLRRDPSMPSSARSRFNTSFRTNWPPVSPRLSACSGSTAGFFSLTRTSVPAARRIPLTRPSRARPRDRVLARAGFRELAIRSISPRLPTLFFRWSFKPGLKAVSYAYYRASRAFGRTIPGRIISPS